METKWRPELILDFEGQPNGTVKIRQATLISASGDGGEEIEGEGLGDIFKNLLRNHKYLFSDNEEFVISSRWWKNSEERI